MQLSIDGRNFLVTGAAQGIGRAITRALVEEGARVAAVDIDGKGLADLDAIEAVDCYPTDLGTARTAREV